jgi:P-type E1-E2 ATPase
VTAETTIISMSVSVPVLSEQIRDTEPRVSTAGKRRMMALRCAMRCTPIANVTVMSAGNPSGITDTAMLTTAWNTSTKGMSRIQEGKAEKALDSIRNMLSAEARTLRGGETRMVPAEELVPGDIVLLESGDKIPADLRLVDVRNLRNEEAALTGESVPIDKTTNPVAEKATVGDREGVAFSGTLVASGRGTGVVVATGADTELGRINQMMAAVSALETPLLRQIKKLGFAIAAAIAVVSVVVFMFGRWVHAP